MSDEKDRPKTTTAERADPLKGVREAFEAGEGKADSALVPSGFRGVVAPEPKAEPDEERPFVRRAWFDQAELVGARWWNESFQTFVSPQAVMDPNRRAVLVKIGVWGAVIGGAVLLNGMRLTRRSEPDLPDDLESLLLQQQAGWDVGHPGAGLGFPGATETDAVGGMDWRGRLGQLAGALAPNESRLAPYAVPTLFQALGPAANERLRKLIVPIHLPEMDQAQERGKALAELAARPEAPLGVAVIVDLPGPQAVAVAAGLSGRFAPVFTFDNWPHPMGVVPSHLTLGAALWARPLFDIAARTRPQPAPPAFVLDSNRLNPYRDQASAFDNRYLAKLPTAQNLKSLGVERILYVRPDAGSLTELDDLNDDFVAFERAGISVRALALSDFSEQPVTQARSSGGSYHSHYYYGGHPYYHGLFWSTYHWSPAPAPVRTRVTPPPPRLSPAADYRPTPRPTMFSSRTVGGLGGVGKQKPSGFGRVSMRSGGYGSYRVSSSRSGSFGRSRSSSSG